MSASEDRYAIAIHETITVDGGIFEEVCRH